MSNVVRIEISGPEHSAKTNLLVLLTRFLEKNGINVEEQKIDPQFDKKLNMTDQQLIEKLKDKTVIITEMQTRL